MQVDPLSLTFAALADPPVGVDTPPVAGRPAEEFVDRHAVEFAGDIPEGMVETGELNRRWQAPTPAAPAAWKPPSTPPRKRVPKAWPMGLAVVRR